MELLDSEANDDASKLHKRRLMSKYDSIKVHPEPLVNLPGTAIVRNAMR